MWYTISRLHEFPIAWNVMCVLLAFPCTQSEVGISDEIKKKVIGYYEYLVNIVLLELC